MYDGVVVTFVDSKRTFYLLEINMSCYGNWRCRTGGKDDIQGQNHAESYNFFVFSFDMV
jgi:hypothetical protein